MADNEQTREEEVTENIEAVVAQRGEEAYNQIMAVCLKDISVSLAMLVDAGSSSDA